MEQNIVSKDEGDKNLFPASWLTGETRPPQVKVKHAKVILEEDAIEVAEKSGVPIKNVSKGFAFVEFSEHLHALAALRVLNNNPEYAYLAAGGKPAMKLPERIRPRLIVEFAVENAAKVQKRKKKLELLQKRNAMKRNADIAEGRVGKEGSKKRRRR